MLLAFSMLGAGSLVGVLGYVWGRTHPGKPYDVSDSMKPCPGCGQMMVAPGEGMAPVCWPCNSRRLPAPTGRPVEVSR